MGYIYLITNTITGKKYIGQSVQRNINKRWNAEKQCKGVGVLLYRTIKKHGIEKFKFQVLIICFNIDCNKYEEEYIKKYNTLSPHGYNLDSGGKNNPRHNDTKERIRISLTGRKQSIKEIEAKSERMKGVNNMNYGKPMSDEQKRKISETKKRKNNENPTQLSEAQLNGLKIGRKMKTVLQCDKVSGEIIKIFENSSIAGKELNIHPAQISNVCNPNKLHFKTAGGFIWKYC